MVLVAVHGEMPDAAALRGLRCPSSPSTGCLGDETPSAGVDHHAGGTMATRHLLDLGHRRIAHIAGPAEWTQAEARQAGFLEALDQAGVAAGTGRGRRLVAPRRLRGLPAHPRRGPLHHSAVRRERPDGHGRPAGPAPRRAARVPDDVCVVGFDDIPEASFSQPPLTTIRQDFGELGREAVRLVVGAIDG